MFTRRPSSTMIPSFIFCWLMFISFLAWPGFGAQRAQSQVRNISGIAELRDNVPNDFRARLVIDRTKELPHAAKFWATATTIMLWRFFSNFHELSGDWSFPYQGLNYSVRQTSYNATDPQLRNCHVIWGLQRLAEIWYHDPVSNEAAVSLEIFESHQQWRTIAWLYLRNSNMTSTSLGYPDATLTTMFSGIDGALAPNATSLRFRPHASTPSFTIARSRSNRRGLPAPNERFIEPFQLVNETGFWYTGLQSIARTAGFPFRQKAPDVWRHDDDEAQLSYVWRRNVDVEPEVAWVQITTEIANLGLFQPGHSWAGQGFGEVATIFKDAPNATLSYGTLSLRKYPNTTVLNPHTS